MDKIQVTRSSMPSFKEFCEEIKPMWENRWLSNRGNEAIKLEKALQEYLDVTNVALFANGHVGLEVPIDTFDLKGKVVTTPYTHCSTTHAIVRNGLTPVFCDINDKDYTIDADRIEEYIDEDTCAIMATHVYGYVCDVEKIQKIADKYNLKVFYDAAHAFGVRINDVGVANYGDFSMFSCHATKVYHTIEGGIGVFKSKEMRNKAEKLINFGFVSQEQVDYVSTNARMNEFEAAMGICNLRHINDEIARRKLASDRYVERLSGVKGIKLIDDQSGVTRNYSYFPVFFDGYKKNRNEIQTELADNQIFARKYFYPLTSELHCYETEHASSARNTPVAKHAAETVLTLPMYADLTIEDVDRICDVILK